MTEYDEFFDILVLGNGICAQSILFEMSNNSKFDLDSLKVAQISQNSVLAPCSDNTTSVVSLNGTTKGNSDLGDMIVESFHYTKEYQSKLKGFYPGDHYFLLPSDEHKKKKFIRRHESFYDIEVCGLQLQGATEENFVVNNKELSEFLDQEINKCDIRKIESVITDIASNKIVTCLNGKKYKANIIISALGAYSNHFFKNFTNAHLSYSKTIAGDYITFERVNLGKKSFVVSSGHHNMVYRHFNQTVLIGGTTLDTQWDSVDFVEIKEQYDFYKDLFKEKIPSFDKAIIRNGKRHKGRKRMPYCDEIIDGVYSMHGVYKNGYTFSFFLAKKLIDKINP
ncbi:FAD-dependent oxidoreductase [Halobacteriovorax sp. HLS]|uniref:FAD-dependent oxidoreductase n=1 Tax=Halobacteriovorax sp. HLS TaxID=2234000 RepID=UPI000FDC1ABA|nr:FAD-dependent oxidoreductase [Halobacteriovorax sp. HLS]